MEWLTVVALNNIIRTIFSSQYISRLMLTTMVRNHVQNQFLSFASTIVCFSMNWSMVIGHAQQIVSYIKKYEQAADMPDAQQ